MDEPEGDYRLVVPGGGNARTQAILQTALAGLRAIARSYPGTLRVRTLAGKASAPPKRSAPPRRSEKN
jgi:hypothetical protein